MGLFCTLQHHARTAILSALVVLLFAGCSFLFDEQKTLLEGKHLQQENKHASAIIEFKKVLQHNPQSREARRYLASSYLETGQLDLAEKELLPLKKDATASGEVMTLWARLLLLQGKYKQVINDTSINAINNIQPADKVSLILSHAYAKMALGLNDEARDLIASASKMSTITFPIDMAYARLSMINNKKDEALGYINKAILAEENNVEAWATKAKILLARNEHKPAAESLKKVVELASKQNRLSEIFQARLLLAQSALFQSDDKAAREYASGALKMSPQHPQSNYLMAVVNYKAKDYKSAKENLVNVLKSEPDDLRSILLLGASHYALAEYEQSNYRLEQFVSRVPEHMQARKMLAAVQVKLGRSNNAIEVLKASPDGDDEELLRLMGNVALHNNQASEAIKYYKAAKDKPSDNDAARLGLAKAYIKNKDFENAIEELSGKYRNTSIENDVLLLQAYLNKGDLFSARKLSSQLLDKNPKSPIPYFLSGVVEEFGKNTAQATAYFKKSLEKDGDFVPALLQLGKIEFESNKLRSAETYFTRILKSKPGNVKALLGMAYLAERSNESGKAQNYYEKAYDADKELFISGFSLGRFYLKTKQADKAVLISTALKDLHPDKPAVYLFLIEALLAAGKHERALDAASVVIKKWPERSVGYTEKARVYAVKKNNKEAMILLTQAIKLQPDDIKAQKMLFGLHIRTGNEAAAITLAKKMVASESNVALGNELLGDIYTKRQQYALAIKHYKESSDKKPGSIITGKLATSYEKNNQQKYASGTLRSWLDTNPEDLLARIQLALMLTRFGENASAVNEYEIILKQQPDNISALNNMAVLLSDVDINRALKFAEKAYQLDKSIPAIQDTFGWLLHQAGNNKKALPLLKQAAEMSKNPTISYHYAVVLAALGEKATAREILAVIHKQTFDEKALARELYKQLAD